MTARAPDRRRLARPPQKPVLDALVELLGGSSAIGRQPASPDREDAVMEAIVRVLEWEVDSTERSIHATVARRYASRAVQNILIDRFRNDRSEPSESIDSSPGPSEWPSEASQSNPLSEISTQLMNELDERQGDLLRAYFAGSDYFHDESVRQALSPGAARVRIHRLLKHLRERGIGFLAQESAIQQRR